MSEPIDLDEMRKEYSGATYSGRFGSFAFNHWPAIIAELDSLRRRLAEFRQRTYGAAHCLYCGYTGERKLFAEARAETLEHGRVCDKHPMRVIERKNATLESQLAEAQRHARDNETAHLDLLAKWDSLTDAEKTGHAKAYHLLLSSYGSLCEDRDVLKHAKREHLERVADLEKQLAEARAECERLRVMKRSELINELLPQSGKESVPLGFDPDDYPLNQEQTK